MRGVWLFYPLLELWSLIELGAKTSVGLALLWVLGAGFIGISTIRLAGAQVLLRLQAAQRDGALRSQLLAGDFSLAIAGILLVIPGLLSDALAVLVLIRPFRQLLGLLFAARWTQGDWVSARGYSQPDMQDDLNKDVLHSRPTCGDAAQQDVGVTLEGEFRELNSEARKLSRQDSKSPDSKSP